MQVNILGVPYEVSYTDKQSCKALEELDGFCDTSSKKIVVDDMKDIDNPTAKKDLGQYKQQVARHECIHAFLYESGLDKCADWATEEMVDWLAIQFPKLLKCFEDLKIS